mgnify:CR=1 FL=1
MEYLFKRQFVIQDIIDAVGLEAVGEGSAAVWSWFGNEIHICFSPKGWCVTGG